MVKKEDLLNEKEISEEESLLKLIKTKKILKNI